MNMGFNRGPLRLMEDGDYGVEEDAIGDEGYLSISVSFGKKNSCRKRFRKKQPSKKQPRKKQSRRMQARKQYPPKKHSRKASSFKDKHLNEFWFQVVCREVDSSAKGGQGVVHHSRKMPVTGHCAANNTGSEHTAGFVKKCLENCRSHHPGCQMESMEAPWYPTRLVEVLEGSAARVIETSETEPTGPYATLSHCWGASRIITATTKNIDHLKKHIPMLDLPKTFSDALQFIKAIGISFIWIDSLCIIQDSDQDWECESRTMLQVYRYAECNLAAAGSKDSHGGLFAERNYAILPSGWHGPYKYTPELKREYGAIPFNYFTDAFDKEIGSSRLMTRGWVFQERAASRRVIAFGRDQVFWDCSDALESDLLPSHDIRWERFDDWAENRIPPAEENMMIVPKIDSPGVPESFYSLEAGLQLWQFLVQKYSACAFTFSKDRPVAILGVAQMMSNALKAQPTAFSTAYWAGLWVRDMRRQLEWKVARTGLRKNCHAPSWSWLSIDGPVDWDSLRFYSEDSENGSKISQLATVAWSHDKTTKNNPTFHEVSAELKIWCNLYILHVKRPRPVNLEDDVGYYRTIKLDDNDIEADYFYFLPLNCSRSQFTGILVNPAENMLGTYKRCGRAVLGWLPFKLEPIKNFLRLPGLEKQAKIRQMLHLMGESLALTEFAYEKYDSELGYLIRII